MVLFIEQPTNNQSWNNRNRGVRKEEKVPKGRTFYSYMLQEQNALKKGGNKRRFIRRRGSWTRYLSYNGYWQVNKGRRYCLCVLSIGGISRQFGYPTESVFRRVTSQGQPLTCQTPVHPLEEAKHQCSSVQWSSSSVEFLPWWQSV